MGAHVPLPLTVNNKPELKAVDSLPGSDLPSQSDAILQGFENVQKLGKTAPPI
jgi:hypothetical protein